MYCTTCGHTECHCFRKPLGLRPRPSYDDERLEEVRNAIIRYMDASLTVPTEWVDEYHELVFKIRGKGMLTDEAKRDAIARYKK